MAHWIIEDHGFGGTNYRCSECSDSWNDNYHDYDKETCPKCGAPINEDENEYIENKKTVRDIPILPPLHLGKFIKRTDETEIIRKYEEREHKLLQVSGYDVEKLIELFAAGYTLQPPSHDLTMFEFDDLVNREWVEK